MRAATLAARQHLPLVPLLLLVFAPGLAAQSAGAPRDSTRRQPGDSAAKITRLTPISVTATRTEKRVFRTAAPVLVVDSAVVRQEAPNGIADLFRNLPGVDVTGVGPNQTRLMIRGQRGQRILLAEDGVRLNNVRRQQDFGELPALTDINGVNRVEIVRGPASVLYGTDAIGGVVNQITLGAPGAGADPALHASVGYRYGSADAQSMVHGRVAGRNGRLGFALSGGYRDASAYTAPSGTFGQLSLGSGNRVNDTGVRDGTVAADLAYDLGRQQNLSLRISRYDASKAGFGYVSPAALGDPNGVLVRLLYPEQHVTRITGGWHAGALGSLFADRLTVTGYTTQNDRTFDQQITIPLGAPFPAGANIAVQSRNVTDIATYGFRVEAAKVIAARHTLIYGIDGFLDRSKNGDTSTTTMTMFGPPTSSTSTAPTVPWADYWSGGAFAQAEFQLHERFVFGLGARGQALRSKTRFTPGMGIERAGIAASNQTLVGAASVQFRATQSLNLVATVGRAFRAPNLVERYFDGVTAEGNGYQVANPGLKPETSLNVDIGFKFRRDRFYGEATYFSNTISDGIRITPLGTRISGFPAFQNQNVDKLRDRGLEALAEADIGMGLSAIGHFTKLVSKNPDANAPVGDSYSSKVGGELAWREPKGRFALAYEIRHQGERKDILLSGSPVGAVLPPFTTHGVRLNARLPELAGATPTLGLALVNLTNRLYSEASNTSFFRPEAGRSAIVTVRLDF